MQIEGTEVARAAVKEFKLELQWSNGEWEQWGELQGAPEYNKIKEVSQAKLNSAKMYRNKGKGKGPDGSQGNRKHDARTRFHPSCQRYKEDID